jgi:hypothetical protein
MHRFVSSLALALLAGCATYHKPESPERWLTKHQAEHHYQHSELAPEIRVREVPASVAGEAVSSLYKEKFLRLSDADFKKYGGDSLERLPGQFAYLLRAVRPTDRPYKHQVYRDHVEHKGHHHPPVSITTLARMRGTEFPPLQKTAVVYVDSRPPDKLNVDYMIRR